MNVNTQAIQDFTTKLSNTAYKVDDTLSKQVKESLPNYCQNVCINVIRSPGHTVAVVLTLLATPVSTFLATCFWAYKVVRVLTPAVKALFNTHMTSEGLKSAEDQTIAMIRAEAERTIPALFFGACLVSAVALSLFIFQLNFLAFCVLPFSVTAAVYFGKDCSAAQLPTPWTAPAPAVVQPPAVLPVQQNASVAEAPVVAAIPVAQMPQPVVLVQGEPAVVPVK